ncbi:MAG: hypothetical protein Q7T82_11870 [Armatimonadota bacterium]|nr:hypothetical protein [Armatimonadota bacterium]
MDLSTGDITTNYSGRITVRKRCERAARMIRRLLDNPEGRNAA